MRCSKINLVFLQLCAAKSIARHFLGPKLCKCGCSEGLHTTDWGQHLVPFVQWKSCKYTSIHSEEETEGLAGPEKRIQMREFKSAILLF